MKFFVNLAGRKLDYLYYPDVCLVSACYNCKKLIPYLKLKRMKDHKGIWWYCIKCFNDPNIPGLRLENI